MILIFETLEEAIEYSLLYWNELDDDIIRITISTIKTWIDRGSIDDTEIVLSNDILIPLIKKVFERKMAAQIAS